MNLFLVLTHNCNLACRYCYSGRKFPASMSYETVKKAIDLAIAEITVLPRKEACLKYLQIGFIGGEPLMEWETLKKATDYAEKCTGALDIKLMKNLTTNGSLLDEEKYKYLLEHDFFTGLSIDGNQKMHDMLRPFKNGRGSHKRCTEPLKWFTGSDANGEVISVVDPGNVSLLMESVKWLCEKGIRNITLNPNFYKKWSSGKLAEWNKVYQKIGDFYINAYRKSDPVNINFIDGKIETHIFGSRGVKDRCSFGEYEIAVAPSGNIYPCERVVGEDSDTSLNIGNVYRGFDHKKRNDILEMRGNESPECRTCSYNARCVNWCSCVNYHTTGKLNRVDGTVCFHERISIEIADRVAETLFKEKTPAFIKRFYQHIDSV